MTIVDHNKARNGSPSREGRIGTLGDLRDFIAVCDLPANRKGPIRSAIKRADELVGHGALDLPADAARLLESLDRFSPAMAGMTSGAFANMKSRIRAAFRLASGRLVSSARGRKLTPAWSAISAELGSEKSRELSRFFGYASDRGWLPEDVTDQYVERFAAYLREDVAIEHWEVVVKRSIKAWNRLAKAAGHDRFHTLTPPLPKRTPYWVKEDDYPEGLKADAEAFLRDIAKPVGFAGVSERALKPATVTQYRNLIRTLVSALVASGARIDQFTSLREVISPDNIRTALLVLHDRAAGQVTRHMKIHALRSRRLARWCGLPDEDLKRITELAEQVHQAMPVVRAMTEKNRALIDRLDEQRFRDLIYLLPHTLLNRAGRQRKKVRGAALVRAAVAIELLLTCSMRRANLVELELDRSIRKIGSGRDARWVIECQEEDVKNGQWLRYQLPEESARLLELYLTEWRPLLCSTPNPWLFPAANGERIDARAFAGHISRQAKRELGVRITPHQFRHISVELHLRDHPDGLNAMTEHLGHRDPNTTRRYYARPKQQEASRRYQEQAILRRREAAARTGRRQRRDRTEEEQP